MTPELWKEVIVGSVAVFFTAIFTGVPATLLFWWTWQRDQERLWVQKYIPYVQTVEGTWVQLQDNLGPQFHVLIRNRSLFPVHISAVGFQIGDEVIQLDQALYPQRLKRNPDPISSAINIPDDSFDPQELGSFSFLRVSCGHRDRLRLSEALSRVAAERNDAPQKLIMSHWVAAVVVTESGKQFTSMPGYIKFFRRWFPVSTIT